MTAEPHGARATWLLAAAVIVLTICAFWPSLRNGFVNWDDDEYVVNNPCIRAWTVGNIRTIWTQSRAASYQPLVFTTHLLEYRAWGLCPAGYHAVNLAFHVLTSLLVMWFLMELGLGRWSAALTAAWFGVHPLHVESVAWIAERKDVLCAFFYMLALCLYVKNSRRAIRLSPLAVPPATRAASRFPWMAFAVYVLALLSKPMAVTWPVVVLLCDWYMGRERNRRYWLQSMAIVIPSLILVGLIWAIHAKYDPQGNNLPGNFQMACRAAAWCLWKIVAPVSLSVFYPRMAWKLAVPFSVAVTLAAIVMAAILAWAWRRRAKKLLLAAGWYAVTFLPVSGIVSVGFVFTADRFMYLPSVGPLFAVACGAAFLTTRWPRVRPLLIMLVAASLAVLMHLTWLRCQVWRDGESLWLDASRKAPNHYTLRFLGMAQIDKGKFSEAEISIRRSFQDSETQYGRYYLAEALRGQGRAEEAASWYERFLSEQDWYIPALTGYGLSLMDLRRPSQAVEVFARCVQQEPESAVHLAHMGWALMEDGRPGDAALVFNAALKIDPGNTVALYNDGVLFMRTGRYSEAEDRFRRVLAVEPRHQYALVNLGFTLGNAGKAAEARAVLRRALEQSPGDGVAHEALNALEGRK